MIGSLKKLALATALSCGFAVVAQAQWPQTYDGGVGFDYGKAVVTDSAGNVYVGGTIVGDETGDDIVVIKYSRFGEALWAQIWDSEEHLGDRVNDLALDSNGNVVVVGETETSSEFDMITLSYDPDGNLRWASQLDPSQGGSDFAYAVACDAVGNAIVTGSVSTAQGSDYYTFKLNGPGDFQWGITYSGGGDNFDTPRDIAVDASNNIFVTGMSLNLGNYYDYATIKYGPAGTQQWVRTFDSADSLEDPSTVAIDGVGNVIVTGSSDGSSGTSDVATVKYTNTGAKVWQTRTGTGNIHEFARDMVLDETGNVYIVGTSGNDGEFSDVLTIKLHSDGTKAWSKLYSAKPKSFSGDTGVAIEVANDGSVFVAAALRANNSSEGESYGCLKYTNAGTLLYSKTYRGPGDGSAAPNAMAIDRARGKVYITGVTFNSDTGYFDIGTAKF